MQTLELFARIAHVPAHGRVRPCPLGVAEEAQVQLDEPRHHRHRVAIEAQVAKAGARKAGALHVVVVEGDPAARLEPARGGLADVVQQGGEPQRHIGLGIGMPRPFECDRLPQHRQRVLVDILVVVVLVDLEAQRRHLRQELREQTGLDQQTDAPHGIVRRQQPNELALHALGAHDRQRRREPGDRLARLGGDGEAQLRGEPGGAQHPQRIVAEAHPRVDRGAQHARDQVLHTPRGVDERPLGHAQRHRVDRKVAAHEVVVEHVAEGDHGLAGRPVVAVGAVRRDLDLLALYARADRAERPPDVPLGGGDRRDDPQDVIGPRVRGEVEVVRRAANQRIAHRAAHDRQLEPCGGERVGDADHDR